METVLERITFKKLEKKKKLGSIEGKKKTYYRFIERIRFPTKQEGLKMTEKNYIMRWSRKQTSQERLFNDKNGREMWEFFKRSFIFPNDGWLGNTARTEFGNSVSLVIAGGFLWIQVSGQNEILLVFGITKPTWQHCSLWDKKNRFYQY